MLDIREIWNDSGMGLTAEDFDRWPDKRTFQRNERHAEMLSAALNQGSLMLPVHAVGECTTYDVLGGHPSFGAARHDATFFTVSGVPGTPTPTVTCMRSRGILKRRIEVVAFAEYDGFETEEIETFPSIGYVDIQLSYRSMPVGRIGFPYFKETPLVAQTQAQTVLRAILKCQDGSLI